MKRILCLLSGFFTTALAFSQTLISKNIDFNGIRYEYQLMKTDDKHVKFKICTVVAPPTCQESREYVLEFDKALFAPEFKTMLTALDGGLTAFLGAAPANQSSFDALVTDLHTISLAKINEKTPAQKKIEELQARLKDLEPDGDDQEPIGVLSIPDQEIIVYKPVGRDSITEVRRSRVKQVEVNISHGSIQRRGLKITLDDGTVFFNRQAPISFASFFRRKGSWMERYDSYTDSPLLVVLRQVLDYNFFGTLNYPSDRPVTLTKDKRSDTLRIGTALNHLIEMTVYTDLLGLLGRKANGLIQTEISGNIITNTASLDNSDIVIHNFIRPYIRLSKYDSKFASLDSSAIIAGPGKRDTVNRTLLNQISYLQAGVKTNLIHFGIGINQFVNINAGADINLVNGDSLYNKDIIFFNYYPEIQYGVSRIKNFGMDMSLKFLRQRISDNANFVNRGSIWVFNPFVTLSYYTSKKRDNRVYFRFSYFDNLDDGKYNFTQFQIGYKTGFNFN